MKRIKFLLSLLVFFLAACHKEASVDNSVEPLSANINGQSWVATNTFSYVIGGYIDIEGVDSIGRSLSLVLNNMVRGNYPLSRETASAAAYMDRTTIHTFTTNFSKDPSLAGGQVTITEINKAKKTISGTFSMSLYNDTAGYKITVTQGNFKNLPYDD